METASSFVDDVKGCVLKQMIWLSWVLIMTVTRLT